MRISLILGRNRREAQSPTLRMLRVAAAIDVIVCPVFPGPAPLHGKLDDAGAAYTSLFNLTGWPAVVVRAGTSPGPAP